MRYLLPAAIFLLVCCCGIQTGEAPGDNPGKGAKADKADKAAKADKAKGTVQASDVSGQSGSGNGGGPHGSGVAAAQGDVVDATTRQDPASKPTSRPDKDKPAAGKSDSGKATTKPNDTKPDPKRGPQTEEEEAKQLPKGTDPADLAARKSSQDMLKAEKKLKEMLKAGKIKGIQRLLSFEEISSWPYEDGLKGMPKSLNKLNGKTMLMIGFMLPIDEVENIKEFLLVQSLWSCCYGQPPDINGVVRVVMNGKKRIDYEFEPIKVAGKFVVKPTIEDGFCVDIYQLHADSVEVIK